jgi:hypothetical protein
VGFPSFIWTIYEERKMRKTKEYPKELLKEHLYYDETSPTFLRWNKDIFSGKDHKVLSYSKGDVAGCFDKNGYLKVRLKRKEYKVHRVVLVLHDIALNKKMVDHVDGNKLNNRLENLRLVDRYENARNQKKFATNSTGVTGVYLLCSANKYNSYLARIVDLDGKRVSRSFSLEKFGEQEAFRLACEWRKQKIAELNEQGAGYTERHGT